MITEELKNIKSTRHDVEQFGFLVGGVLVALGAWFAWTGAYAWKPVAGAGTLLVLGGAFAPFLIRPLQRAWMMLAVLLGFVMTRVILALLFFLVLTPIALIARIVGKQFLELDFRGRPTPKTYWNRRENVHDVRRRLERQF